MIKLIGIANIKTFRIFAKYKNINLDNHVRQIRIYSGSAAYCQNF
jgi:hypothetical protein